MLVDIISSLRRQDQWKFFVQFFEQQEDKLIKELRGGSIDLDRLNQINTELNLYERLKNLDQWAIPKVKRELKK